MTSHDQDSRDQHDKYIMTRLFAKVQGAQAATAGHRVKIAQIITEVDATYLISDQLAKAVNELAVAEGRLEAWTVVHATAEAGNDPYQALARRISNGADDGWSGRTNDVKRAKFDGLLAVLSDLPFELER